MALASLQLHNVTKVEIGPSRTLGSTSEQFHTRTITIEYTNHRDEKSTIEVELFSRMDSETLEITL